MVTCTKASLAESIVNGVGLNHREAKELVDQFFVEISELLESGCAVKISGFGVFSLLDKPLRPGRNPKTGKEVAIEARRVVTWHPSGNLRARVEASPRLAIEKAEAA
jgi:integration host factor subunit alpha